MRIASAFILIIAGALFLISGYPEPEASPPQCEVPRVEIHTALIAGTDWIRMQRYCVLDPALTTKHQRLWMGPDARSFEGCVLVITAQASSIALVCNDRVVGNQFYGRGAKCRYAVIQRNPSLELTSLLQFSVHQKLAADCGDRAQVVEDQKTMMVLVRKAHN